MEDISLNPTMFQGFSIVLIIIVAYAATKLITHYLERFAERFPARRLVIKRLLPVVQLVSYAVPAYLIIRILLPDQKSLQAVLYAASVGLIFAGRDMLKDLIGGIVVLVDTSFQVGDRIRVGDLYGEVMKISLRSTKIETLDNEMVTVPNSQLMQSALSNVSAGAVDSPITIHVYLPLHADLARTESVVREAVLTSKAICLAKPISIAVKEMSQDGKLVVDMAVRAYVFDARYEEDFLTDVNRRVKQAVFDSGLLIEEARAFDQRFDENLSQTLIALSRRFADAPPPLPYRNGH